MDSPNDVAEWMSSHSQKIADSAKKATSAAVARSAEAAQEIAVAQVALSGVPGGVMVAKRGDVLATKGIGPAGVKKMKEVGSTALKETMKHDLP